MRFSFPTRCLVAAIVLAPILFAFAVQKDEPPVGPETAAYMICPVSPLFSHGGYVTYYAKQCGSGDIYRTWDDAPGLPLADASVLCGTTTNCIGPIGFEKAEKSASGGRMRSFLNPVNPDMKNKGYGKTNDDKEDHNPDPQPNPDPDKGTAKRLAHYYVKYNRKEAPQDPVYAQLILIWYQHVDAYNKKYSPGIIGTGHEVKKRFKENGQEVVPDFIILPDDVETAGHRCHVLKLGDVEFTVFLHKNSPPDKNP